MNTKYFFLNGFLLIAFASCVSTKKFVQYKEELNNSLQTINQQITAIAEKQINLTNKINTEASEQSNTNTAIKQSVAELALQISDISAQLTNVWEKIELIETRNSTNYDYNQDFDAPYLSECNYLTNEEKAAIYYLNYARRNPQQFCEKYLKPYSPSYKNYAFDERKESLIETLNTMTPILDNEIKPNESLYELALCFAEKSGELGITGHDRSPTDCPYPTGTWGECCSYGKAIGLEIIISLLIDAGENNAALGHRRICLNPVYTKIGISIQSHKEYGVNAVLDFGN